MKLMAAWRQCGNAKSGETVKIAMAAAAFGIIGGFWAWDGINNNLSGGGESQKTSASASETHGGGVAGWQRRMQSAMARGWHP